MEFVRLHDSQALIGQYVLLPSYIHQIYTYWKL